MSVNPFLRSQPSNLLSILLSRPLNASLALLCLAALPIVPLLTSWRLEPIRSFHEEWLAVMAGLLACLACLPSLFKTGVMVIPRLVILPVFFAAYLALQTQLLPHVVAQHAYMAIAYLLWAALLMVAIGELIAQVGQRRVNCFIALGLVAAGVFSSLYECASRLQGHESWWGGTAQPNHYADLLALSGIALLYCRNELQWLRKISLLLALIIVLGLSLTPSRSVWLYWLAAFVLCGGYQRAWLRPLMFGLSVYVLLQFLWAANLLPEDWLQPRKTATQRIVQEVGGVPVRLHIWRIAWELFLQSPWFGQGFGQFDLGYFQAGQPLAELSSRLEHAHNIVLHLLAELGVLPVLVLAAVIIGWLKPLFGKAGQDQQHLTARAWLLLSFTILSIHSLLEYPLWYAQFLGVGVIFLALGDNTRWTFSGGKLGAYCATGIVGAGFIFAALHEWHYSQMERAFMRWAVYRSPQSQQQLIEVSQQAAEKAPLLFPYVTVLFAYTGDVRDMDMRPNLTLLTEAAFNFLPSKDMAYRHALLQALNGEHELAVNTLEKSLTAYPAAAEAFTFDVMRLQGKENQHIEVLMDRLIPFMNQRLQQATSPNS